MCVCVYVCMCVCVYVCMCVCVYVCVCFTHAFELLLFAVEIFFSVHVCIHVCVYVCICVCVCVYVRMCVGGAENSWERERKKENVYQHEN